MGTDQEAKENAAHLTEKQTLVGMTGISQSAPRMDEYFVWGKHYDTILTIEAESREDAALIWAREVLDDSDLHREEYYEDRVCVLPVCGRPGYVYDVQHHGFGENEAKYFEATDVEGEEGCFYTPFTCGVMGEIWDAVSEKVGIFR